MRPIVPEGNVVTPMLKVVLASWFTKDELDCIEQLMEYGLIIREPAVPKDVLPM